MSPTPAEALFGRRTRLAAGIACALLLACSVAWSLYLSFQKPVFNFDLVDYVALTIEWREPDPALVQQRTYEVLRAELPPEVYADFTTGGAPTVKGPFRERIVHDLEAFEANLGFHRGRYLYTLTVLGLHALGVPLVTATAWPNRFFWTLNAILVVVWARRHFALAPAALLALGVLYSPPVLSQLPGSSPDSMAMFFLALAACVLIERRAFRAGLALLTLTVLVRSDFVLVCGGIGLALFLFAERERRPSVGQLALWLGACAVIYLAIARTARDPGWWAAFIGVNRRVGTFDELPPVKASFYLIGMREKLRVMHYLGYDIGGDGSYVRGSTFVVAYAVAAVIGATLALRARWRELDLHVALLVGLAIATAVRIVVFPNLWDRYFVYLWVPVPLVLVALFTRLVARASEPPAAETRPG